MLRVGLGIAMIFSLVCPAFAQDSPKALRVGFVSGSKEYDSDKSLPILQQRLEKKYHVTGVRVFAKSDTDLPGVEKLADCDVIVLFTRRLKLEGEQLASIKKVLSSGKPIVGIRTASHAIQTWLDFDADVLGGSYKGHTGNNTKTDMTLTDAGKTHPVLNNFKPFTSEGTLYKNAGNARDTVTLLMGNVKDERYPLAWTREHKKGRIFYTSLGHQKDFEQEAFLEMLENAVFWAANQPPVLRVK